jgi:hypothetical protein
MPSYGCGEGIIGHHLNQGRFSNALVANQDESYAVLHLRNGCGGKTLLQRTENQSFQLLFVCVSRQVASETTTTGRSFDFQNLLI